MGKNFKVILLLAISVEYGRGLLRGITKFSSLRGNWEIYLEPLERIRASKLPTGTWDVDGVIVHIAGARRFEELVTSRGLPVVAFSEIGPVPGVPNIICDWKMAGEMAAQHLIERGFVNFGFFGIKKTYWSQQRAEGYARRLKKAGFVPHVYEKPFSHTRRLKKAERDKMLEWLKARPKPMGLMAASDELGQDIVECCRTVGLQIPEEVAIVGVDDDEFICGLCNPPLSSVVFNNTNAGFKAAALLDKMMSGEEKTPSDIIIQPTHVVARQSTDIMAIKDADIVRAVRYINAHDKERLQVSEVASEVGLSRRMLERRFRETLGRSVYDEIKRVRLDLAIRMLLETDLPIGSIASDLNYPSPEHFSRFFSKEKGVSPLIFRKRNGHLY